MSKLMKTGNCLEEFAEYVTTYKLSTTWTENNNSNVMNLSQMYASPIKFFSPRFL